MNMSVKVEPEEPYKKLAEILKAKEKAGAKK
jgi:hypothetical protein